jgi:hypothetical protein
MRVELHCAGIPIADRQFTVRDALDQLPQALAETQAGQTARGTLAR